MGLSPGTKLGPYEILSAAGAGGMGEVYRARDTRLDRTVAIKVLPQHLSPNAEVKQRFEREARSISQLQHPHICVLHDVGSENGTGYLVMEYLEGQTLAERLRRGPVALDQLLKIGIEIADALEKAHRSGIIHRDLKPANIMLTKSGAKLMDFGLARGLTTPAGVAVSAQSGMPSFTATPTITSPASPLTSEGTVIGTLNYMAPEQIQGSEVDARSDIFAFGCVLYEMATGKRAFEGKSHISVASAILETEPIPVRILQRTAPEQLDSVIGMCLAKDPEQRFACAHDVKLQLQQIPVKPQEISQRTSSRWMQYATAMLVVVLAVLCAWLADSRLELLRAPQAVLRSQVNLAGAALGFGRNAVAISPDGRYIAYLGRSESTYSIWLKDLRSETEGGPLPGTEEGSSLFWSPDGRYLGFFAGGELKKLAFGSKTITSICEAHNYRGGHWGRNGVILLGTTNGIMQVPENGGTPQPATPAEKNYYDVSPVLLPDGKHFLFVRAQAGVAGMFTRGDLKLASLGGPSTTLLSVRGATIRYDREHLLYLTAQGLVAQRFDMRSLQLQGEPIQLVSIDTQFPVVNFSISSNGILAYTLSNIGRGREILQHSLTGESKSLGIPPGLLNNPRLSPDGTRIAYDVNDAMSLKRDIWIFDLKRQTPTRLTFGDGNYHDPMWSPDGKRVVCTSNGNGDHALDFSIVTLAADGLGSSETLYRASSNTWARSWSRDGRFLFLETSSTTFGLPTDIGALDLSGDRKLHPVIQDRFTHRNPQISPDGKWLAFVSTEAGAEEVFVQPFPGPGLRQRVSLSGGVMPRWRGDGRELYFVTGDNKVAAASISSGPSGLEIGKVQALFAAPPLLYPNGNPFDVSSDGKMFILCSTGAQQTVSNVNLIVNWNAGLINK